jgi:hypothetical protein
MRTIERPSFPSDHLAACPAKAKDAHVFAISTIIITPLAFAVSLLLALPVGVVNAVIIAMVPALFAAAFFGGLYLLAHAFERDERSGAVFAPASDQSSRRARRSRAA